MVQDYARAAEWYQKAAEQGHVAAQFKLGNCYYCGKGVAQDHAKAAEWFLKAAEQGFIYAQYSLGFYYEHGYGMAKDLTKAAEWYQKAADQGNSDAVKALKRLWISTGSWFRRLWKH